MYTCPHCHTALSERRSPPLGIMWICPSCHGRAMSLALLRKTLPKSLVDHLWQQARADQHHAGRSCLSCRRPMTEVPIIPAKNKTVCLDVCTVCHFIWFDPHEFEALPKLEQKPTGFEHLSEEARQALARAQLETLRRDTLTPEREALNIAVRWQIALDILWLVIRILARW